MYFLLVIPFLMAWFFFKLAWFALRVLIWLAIALLVTIVRMFPGGRDARYPSMWWVF